MISVIVCTYNRAHVLSNMIERFFTQDEIDTIDHELIIIDNNSKDDTREVVSSFMHFPNLRYFFEEKQGVSVARNRGVEESRGEIVAFLDDDVIVDRNWIKSLERCMSETKADVVGGRTYLIFKQDPPIWLGPKFLPLLSLVDLGKERLFLQGGEGLFGLNLSFCKSVLKSIGGFNPRLGLIGTKLLCAEEFAVIQKIASLKGKIVYDPNIVVGHIIGPERLEWDYFINKAIGCGKSKARLEPSSGIVYRLLRVGSALIYYINSFFKFYISKFKFDKDPYEEKYQELRLVINKWYFLSRLEQIFDMFVPKDNDI